MYILITMYFMQLYIHKYYIFNHVGGDERGLGGPIKTSSITDSMPVIYYSSLIK